MTGDFFLRAAATVLILAAAPATWPSAARAGDFDCSVVYDEFDSLMNRAFLLKPGAYVQVVKDKLSRAEYNARQKGKLVLRPGREGWGVAIVRSNTNTFGKFLFTWGGPGDSRGTPLMILRDITMFGRVEDGDAPRITREIRVSAGQGIDLDKGLPGEGVEADLRFNALDPKTMYIEAANGATLSFPMQSLCRQ